MGALGLDRPTVFGKQPELRSYEPSWRDRVAKVLMNVFPEPTVEGLMGSRGLGPSNKRMGMGLVDLTPAGIPLAVNEAQRAAGEGDWAGAGLSAMAMVPGAKAGQKAIESGVNEVKQGIRGFHGSPETSLSAVLANPPKRQYDNATSQFGAFLAPNEGAAKPYAGETGRVYSVEAPIAKPYEMSWREFDYFQSPNKAKDGSSAADWTARAEELKQEAIELRQRLAAEGYDGIVVRGGRDNTVKEIASFNDVSIPSIRAFHGSPHDFDRFSMDKIGTGEGAQAYGHGLYFAEAENVAKQYRDQLQWKGADWDQPQVIAQNTIDRFAGDRSAAADYLAKTVAVQEKQLAQMSRNPAAASNMAIQRQATDTSIEAVRLLRSGEEITGKPPKPGRMYEVNVNAHPDEFLDWDKPLSEQPRAVQETIGQILGKPATELDAQGGAELYNRMLNKFQNARMESGGAYNADTSGALRAAGIKGIRYKDAGSRGKDGDGTSNYVVFDDKIIDILRKYGIAGLTAGGLGGAALMGGQSEAQAADGLYGVR